MTVNFRAAALRCRHHRDDGGLRVGSLPLRPRRSRRPPRLRWRSASCRSTRPSSASATTSSSSSARRSWSAPGSRDRASPNTPSSALRPTSRGVRAQLTLLVIVVGVMSAFIKNIGALAIMIPIAFQFAERSKVSASVFLMPMAFASLLGGITTLVGTSPNIIVSQACGTSSARRRSACSTSRRSASTIAVAGFVFLLFFYWLVPERKREKRRHARGARHQELPVRGDRRAPTRRFSARPSPTSSSSPRAASR